MVLERDAKRTKLGLLAFALSCAALFGACAASDLGNKSAGEACTRSGQCVRGLSCVQGSCQQLHDAGTGGRNDGGHALSGDASSQAPKPDAHAADDAGK